MALQLKLNYAQSNDATYITLTDAVGDYNDPNNLTGWGGVNEGYEDIVVSTDITTASSYHLLLDVSVLDSTGTTTEYDTINLYDLANTNGTVIPFASYVDLYWRISPASLTSGGVAMGTSMDRMIDGVYNITYKLVSNSDHSDIIASESQSIFIDGSVRIDVYRALREISRQYDNELNDESREIMESLLKYSYLLAMNASATVSNYSTLVNMLYTLQKLNRDGSRYTW